MFELPCGTSNFGRFPPPAILSPSREVIFAKNGGRKETLPPFLAKMSLGSCAEFINSAGVYKLPPEFINSCRSLKTSVPCGVCKLPLEFINSGGSLKTL